MPVFYSKQNKDILQHFCTMSIFKGDREELCFIRTLTRKNKPISDFFKSYILKLIVDILVTTVDLLENNQNWLQILEKLKILTPWFCMYLWGL